MAVVPECTGSHTIPKPEAERLWSWLLRRQGLCDDLKYASVVEIAHASLGLHAARLPTPFATVLARGTSPAVALSLFSSSTADNVVTLRCMRKTLHSLPLPLAAAAHAATLHFRERDALRSIANHGMSARTVTRVTTAIIDLVEQCGPLNHRAMEATLTDSRTDTVSVRLALKLAWERGVLTYLNRTNCWNREHRRFGLTGRLHPGLDMAMDRHRATTELVIEYFDRYGPASLRDAAWWSGLSRSAITAAMNESARDFVMVHTSWCESPMYMYRDRLEEFRSDSAEQWSSGISFLAHEDVALKAYFESRRRYLGDLPPRTAFNQIGEVLPTVIIDGQLAGTWKWDTSKKAVGWSLVSSCRSTVLRREIRHRAHTLTEALRLGWGAGDRKKVTTAQQGVTPTSSSR